MVYIIIFGIKAFGRKLDSEHLPSEGSRPLLVSTGPGRAPLEIQWNAVTAVHGLQDASAPRPPPLSFCGR